jgi:hypothetical protein
MNRYYTYNNKYLYKIIKLKNINKKDIANNLNLTLNALNIKFSGYSLIYIYEGIVISDMLKMNILNLFAPTISEINLVLNESKILNSLPYEKSNKYNINNEYLRSLFKRHNLKLKDIEKLWGKKRVTVYDKINQKTKITLEEGIKLLLKLNLKVNDVFCPTVKLINNTIFGQNTNVELINEIKDINLLNLYINFEDFKNLCKKQEKKIKDFKTCLGYTTPHVYNKLYNKSTFTYKDIVNTCKFFDLSFNDIFNDIFYIRK